MLAKRQKNNFWADLMAKFTKGMIAMVWLQFILSTFWISLKQIKILRTEWTWKWPRINVGVCSAHLLCNNFFVFPTSYHPVIPGYWPRIIFTGKRYYFKNFEFKKVILPKCSKVPLKCTFLYPKKCNILNFDVSVEYFTPNDRHFGSFFQWKLKPKIIF